MKRLARTELMTDPEIIKAYSYTDFSFLSPFASNFLTEFPNVKTILDLGCGIGNIDFSLAYENPNLTIHAIDGSSEMIKIAKQSFEGFKVEMNLSNRLFFYDSRMQEFPFDGNKFDAIISKDFIHHLSDPTKLWRLINRRAREGTVLYHMDLIRPETEEEAKNLAKKVFEGENKILQDDFYNSLRASLTIDEVKEQLYAYFTTSRESLKVEKSETGQYMIIKGIYHKNPSKNNNYRGSRIKKYY